MAAGEAASLLPLRTAGWLVVVGQGRRDRRLEKLAIEVLTATGEREATIAATEQRGGVALQAMITDES